ncbi:hypothetical protein SAMN04487957_10780 [Halomonas shengliensis]|uniref:Uncharacterized protein n=1 Tax=Halomonas shengliensis TaxID=419597 RepID=A0A1H0K690_9GAMM|nr:hypothetical protein [Halomonas shengliensis]SDO51221.1 hypothetical protein SAMN04487957_10780 [Halomonas shengliensis]
MRPWPLLLLLALAGCQTVPSTLPVAEPPPAAACRWPVGEASPREILARAVDALEAEGFLIRHTATAPVLVSAERTRLLPGYGSRYDDWERHGVFGGIGLGGGSGGIGGGVMIGFGGVGSLTRDATQLERVSLLVSGQEVRVSRDLQVIDWRGRLVEARSASTEAFCQALRRAMPAGGTP